MPIYLAKLCYCKSFSTQRSYKSTSSSSQAQSKFSESNYKTFLTNVFLLQVSLNLTRSNFELLTCLPFLNFWVFVQRFRRLEPNLLSKIRSFTISAGYIQERVVFRCLVCIVMNRPLPFDNITHVCHTSIDDISS